MKVLDVGTGSGYHAAFMAQLMGSTGYIYSLELIPELVKMAKEDLKVTGIENVTVVQGDGSLGLPEYVPYDRINVVSSVPEVPKPLGSYYQELVLATKEDGSTVQELMAVAFVPLVGRFGHEG
jgi:protein-L-isoaspartate(D-aspartate) O-methyltransferase